MLRLKSFRRVSTIVLEEHMPPLRTVAMLVWSLAITGLGDALVNNTIFYRAVLMTDWLFAYFYFAARLFVLPVARKTRL